MINKYKDFVQKLQKATTERKIEWEKTSGHNEYQAAIGGSAVSIRFNPASDFPMLGEGNKDSVSLLLWNSKGENIDEVKAEQGSFDYIDLHSLYDSARRASLKVEETIDEMMAGLEKI
mgnify:CR=1 FL=1